MRWRKRQKCSLRYHRGAELLSNRTPDKALLAVELMLAHPPQDRLSIIHVKVIELHLFLLIEIMIYGGGSHSSAII